MIRTAWFLLVVMLAGTPSGSAQIGRPIDENPPIRVPAGSCDPAGNIDEVPFEASSVPLEEWLKEREARQIPMDISVREPELRMDQQTSVSYIATIQLKNPKTPLDR